MEKYTVESPSGKRVTFEWEGKEPPTDVDMDEIFALAEKSDAPKKMSAKEKALAGVRKQLAKPSVTDITRNPEWWRGSGEMAGALIGGKIGAPLGLLGMAGGGILGYLGGKYGERAIAGEPTSLKQIPKDIKSALLQEAVGHGAGAAVRGVAKTAGKLPIFNKPGRVKPEIAERLKLAEELEAGGEQLFTPGEVTEKPAIGAIQAQLDSSMITRNVSSKSNQKKLSALTEFAERMQNKIGEPSFPDVQGKSVQEAIKKHYKQFQAAANKLYNEIPVPPNTPIETKNMRDVAIGISDELGKLKNPSLTRILKIAESGVETGAAELPYTWVQLRSDHSVLKKVIARTSDRNLKRQLIDLSNAIGDDVTAFADTVGDPKLKEILTRANEFYKYGDEIYAGIRDLTNKEIQSIIKTEKPGDIAKMIFTPRKHNIDQITRVRKVSGPAFQNIKASFVSDALGQADQAFSPTAYMKWWNNYPDRVRKTIFAPDEYSGLAKLYKFSDMATKITKENINPSKSGVFVGNFWTIIQAVKHPVLMSSGGLSMRRFAKAYFTNPAFRRQVVNGLNAPATSGEAAKAAARLTAIISQLGPEDDLRED